MSHWWISLRKLVFTWHRRLGAAAALLVVFLAVTGVLLNHGDELALDRSPVQQGWLLQWYGVEPARPTGQHLGSGWLGHDGGHSLYLANRQLGCAAPFYGAVSWQALVVALCGDALLLITPEGDLVESWSQGQGLPAVDAIAAVGNEVRLRKANRVLAADLDRWQIRDLELPADQQRWQQVAALPEEQRRTLGIGWQVAELHWERVVQDLHSGRFFGRAGVWLMDGVALVMVTLATSGLWLWGQRLWLRRRAARFRRRR